MVVLSAAVLGRHGKVLVARQFVDMPRSRIEGLLAAFPKLLSGQDKSRQHTFIETGSVRYVYFPIEGMHVVLITTKGSNIVEDLSTLQLASKCVPEFGMSMDGDVSEATVTDRAFEIICALDEAISAGGQAEQVTLEQIRTFMEMDSHEERLDKMIKKSRMEAAASERKSAESAIADSKRKGFGRSMPGVGSSMGGVGSGGVRMGGAGGGMGGSRSGVGSSSGSGSAGSSAAMAAGAAATARAAARDTAGAGTSRAGGLQLGKKRAGLSLGGKAAGADSALREMGIASTSPTTAGAAAEAGAPVSAEQAVSEAAARAAAAVASQVEARVTEVVSCAIFKDGGIRALEVKGDLVLKVNDEAARGAAVHCAPGSGAFIFQAHPSMDKGRWGAESVICPTKAFPLGGRGSKVLRWKATSEDPDMAPLLVSCWPDALGGGRWQVSVDYSLQDSAWPGISLTSVVISVPLPSGSAGTVIDHCDGSASAADNVLRWRVSTVDAANGSGSLQFTVTADSADSFFPVAVDFEAHGSLSGFAPQSAVDPASGAAFRFSCDSQVRAQGYVVE
ncbi:hypothetical protein FNF27_00141 [Cafeteria roenbergensis]|uniref:Coatomer subunit delta n=2 Tax=Cafeteria roenbergensis TaxID=33653 RepID=A0A5A8EMJ1_CAFRO|nr:hypothetical protein FNF28_03620 [Cafeteria roenbergensis]KAA0178288.1 hypothetical protein FNF27_00141 [Cafeteria roenbergensis]